LKWHYKVYSQVLMELQIVIIVYSCDQINNMKGVSYEKHR